MGVASPPLIKFNEQVVAAVQAMAVHNPHFVLFPHLAPGHMVPMVELAQLLAERGAVVTVFTTPVNAARIKSSIDRIAAAGLAVRFVELPFPCAEVGLPDGCECVDLVPSPHLRPNFNEATLLLKQPLTSHLRDPHHPPPSCILSDLCQPWTLAVARELRIPYLALHITSCFTHLCYRNIRRHGLYDSLADDTAPFPLPDMPVPIQVTLSTCPDMYGLGPEYRSSIIAAEEAADGLVFNTSDELEPWILEQYREATGKTVWTVGPLPLVNKDTDSRSSRGGTPSVDAGACVAWLDDMPDGSVVYVGFGSLTRIRASQIVEIGSGLEASGYRFIWVIKAHEHGPEVERWLSEGFEERTRGRGMVIHGWSPQAAILSHRAVGGAVTQCGWNSVLENVTAGLPMITWPHLYEQFLNEKLVVEVMGVGVAIGVKTRILFTDEKSVVVGREVVESAVRRLMGGGEEGEERRARARELREKAKKAMGVVGSSNVSTTRMIEYIAQFAKKDADV